MLVAVVVLAAVVGTGVEVTGACVAAATKQKSIFLY
jgi:hypothetical protein